VLLSLDILVCSLSSQLGWCLSSSRLLISFRLYNGLLLLLVLLRSVTCCYRCWPTLFFFCGILYSGSISWLLGVGMSILVHGEVGLCVYYACVTGSS